MTTLPAGPASSPVVQLLYWVYRPIPFMEDCARRFGDVFTVRFPANPPFVFFSHPDAIRDIFTADPDRLRAGEANRPLLRLLGDHSLLVLDGARHLAERRLLMPPFHGERMQAYGAIMRDVADRTIDAWPLGEPFPIHPRMQALTLDVIMRTVFGVAEGPTFTRLRERLTRLLAMTGSRFAPLVLLPFLQVDLGLFSPWGWLVGIARDVDEILFAEIRRRRAEGGAGRDDVLSMLVEARYDDGTAMTDQELRDEMLTLLLAGHETTATSLAWVFHRVLERPDVLEKLRTEVRDAAGDGPLELRHVAELEYLDATIKETARLTPILPIVARRLEEPTSIGGHELPAGAVAVPCIYLAHHRPDVWPDAERFEPERFLGRRPTPYEFLPFGGGVRRCLGMAFATYEMKVVLAETLLRAELRAAPGKNVRLVRRGITFAPSAGMPVVLEKRAA